MYYTADKPATIIPTNGMFILDEHADLRTIQVGGTLDWCDAFFNIFYGKSDTYLYLKGLNNNGEIAYLKITIPPTAKALLYPGMTRIMTNENGEVFAKTVDYYIKITELNSEFDVNPITRDICVYEAIFEDGEIHYFNMEELLLTIDSTVYPVELVKQPELHRLLCEELNY